MSVGLPVTKTEIDNRAGDLARRLQQSFDQDVPTLKAYLDQTADNVLVTMGYTQGEVTVLKSAINDLVTLGAVWRGAAAQTPAKDFTAFVKQLWGVGAF